MPDNWEIAIFVHVVGVFALGGATAVSFSTYAMMRSAQTVQEVRVWASLGRVLSQYFVFPITALVLILSGAYLVEELNYAWSEGWIGFSAIAVVGASVVGAMVITPRMKAIGMAAGPAPEGAVPEGITRLLKDPILFGAMHANAMTAIAIVWNMAVRPEDAQALLVILSLAGLGAATGVVGLQHGARSATDA